MSDRGSLAGPSAASGTLFFADPSEETPPLELASGELKTHDIQNVEILATGTWTTMSGQTIEITERDLDEIVANFYELSGRIKPFLKLGHEKDEKQTLLTGYPALGWMHNVRRVGTKMLSDLKKVPDLVNKLIDAGAYRRISAEIKRNWTDPTTGKTYDRVLVAAGILGAVAPAIDTLNDIKNLYGLTITGEVVCFAFPQGETEMEAKELATLTARLDALEARNKTSEQFAENISKALGIEATADPVTAIKALQKEVTDSTTALETNEDEKFAEAVDGKILEAKKAGKLLPASESAVRLMVRGWAREAEDNEGVMEFSTGDGEKAKTVKGSVIDCLTAYFESAPVLTPMGKEFGPGKVDKGNSNNTQNIDPATLRFCTTGHRPIPIDGDSLKRHNAILDYQKEHKDADYFAAYNAVNGIDQISDRQNG